MPHEEWKRIRLSLLSPPSPPLLRVPDYHIALETGVEVERIVIIVPRPHLQINIKPGNVATF